MRVGLGLGFGLSVEDIHGGIQAAFKGGKHRVGGTLDDGLQRWQLLGRNLPSTWPTMRSPAGRPSWARCRL
jgi:hypothetical protein